MEAYNALMYNSQQYDQSVGIFRTSEVVTKTKNSVKYDITLDNKSIVMMEIVSEVTSPILYGTIIYRDKSLDSIPNIIPDNYTFLNVSISRIGDNKNDIEEAFIHNFVVENVELVDIKEGDYRITFKSIYWFIFNNYTIYSSIDQLKSYTTMAYEMLNLNNDFLSINSDYRQSINTGDFMTHSNMPLLESIYELLRSSADTENGFYFLQYDHSKNIFNIRDIKTQYKNYSDGGKTYNAFVVETNENTTDTRAFLARNITTAKELTIEEYSEFVKDFTITEFDYNKREFNETTHNLNKLKQYFPKLSSKEFIFDYKNIPNAIPNSVRRNSGEKLSITFSDDKMYDALFLLGNAIKFTSEGRLDRKSGDMIALEVASNDHYKNKYRGVWFAGAIHHVFSPMESKYQNIFMASRHENRKKMDKNE